MFVCSYEPPSADADIVSVHGAVAAYSLLSFTDFSRQVVMLDGCPFLVGLCVVVDVTIECTLLAVLLCWVLESVTPALSVPFVVKGY